MIGNDFLGMNEMTLIPHLLRHHRPSIREEIAKLLNTVATDCTGRQYLLRKDGMLVQGMIRSMKKDSNDSSCRQNILGALQKLSLR